MKPGDLIADRYRLLRPVGAGAMGTVWAARHELLDREVALKVAKTSALASADARAHFLDEARIVAKLRHPNIVDIADAGETSPGGDVYLAMELLEGEPLSQCIARGPIPPADALAIAAALARGLAAAHGAGVVHRDLKPANIFLAQSPVAGLVPKILDFGVSTALGLETAGRECSRSADGPRGSERGRVLATPAYMSPEQANGDECDARSDIWSLGVVLHEMLTGKRPFAAATYAALLRVIDEQPAPPLPADVPSELRTVVAGCLAKDRADRYPSAEAVLDAIDRARAVIPDADGPTTGSAFFVETGDHTPSSLPRPPRKRPRVALAAAIFAVPVLIGVAALGVVLRRGPSSPAPSPPSPAAGATRPGPEGPGPAPSDAAMVAAPTAQASAVAPPPPATTVAPPVPAPSSSAAAQVPRARATAEALTAPKQAPAPPRGKPVTKVDSSGL